MVQLHILPLLVKYLRQFPGLEGWFIFSVGGIT